MLLKTQIMNNQQYEFGMVGLGVMGRNLMLNIADHDFSVIGLDLDPLKAEAVEEEAGKDKPVRGTISTEEFVKSIRKPRAIMLLVPAGKAVDGAIATLLPLLEPGDMLLLGARPGQGKTTMSLRIAAAVFEFITKLALAR